MSLEIAQPKSFQEIFIDNLPFEWTISRIKNVSTIYGRIGYRGYTIADIVDENSGALSVSPGNIFDDKFTLKSKTFISWEKYYQSPEIMLFENDIVVVKTGSTIGKVALVPQISYSLTLNPQVVVLKKIKLDPLFFYYFLTTDFIKYLFECFQSGGATPAISQEKINNFLVAYPSLNIQKQIGYYLSLKSSAIDKKVNLLSKKADYYKELRKSIINDAVCKGLDKNVKMKESEVGVNPVHWRIGRLKDISKSMSSGATPLTNISAYYENGILNWVNTGDLNDGIINECQYKISEVAIKDYPNLRVNKVGTLLIAMYGATICKVGLLNIEATTNQACCCINFKKDSYSKFVFYWFLANKNKIISLSIGGTQPNISQGIIAKLLIAIPPLEEQIAIATYLDEKTLKIDAIVTNIGKQIETLKELRKTLINDVVTGKIKVSEL